MEVWMRGKGNYMRILQHSVWFLTSRKEYIRMYPH